MKKLTIESIKVTVDKENLNVILFENRTEKYVLYAKTQIDAPNDPVFKPFSFTEAVNITPKKKFSTLNFRLDHKNGLNILYYKNYPVYFVGNNSVNVKNSAYKLILLSGELFTSKSIIPVDQSNVIIPTAASLVASLLSTATSNASTSIQQTMIVAPVVAAPVAAAPVAAPVEVDPVAAAPLVETVEEESESEYEEEIEDEIVDKKNESIKVIPIDEKKEFIQTNEKKESIQTNEKKESIKVIPLVEVEKKEIIEPPVPQIKIVNVDSEIPEKLSVNKLDEIKQKNIKADIEEILHNFNHLFKDIKNEKTDIEKKQLIENKLKEIDLIKENQLKQEDMQSIIVKEKVKPEVIKKDVKPEVIKEDVKQEVIKEDLKPVIIKEDLKPVIKEHKPEYIKVNYQNTIYNLPSHQLLSSKDLNATNLFQTIIPERNYIKQNITYQLENVNSSYLLVFRKQKYLVNKINNTLVIINLVNKSSVIAKNNSNFKLDNYDYILYNNGTLMIPVINKRIYDNSYGMAYNMYLPIF